MFEGVLKMEDKKYSIILHCDFCRKNVKCEFGYGLDNSIKCPECGRKLW
jgi:hypothetical protein